MRPLARFFIRLYPRAWRARYGEEFSALLEDAPPGFPGVLDLCKGALRMQASHLHFSRLALLLSGAGLLAGLGCSFLITPQYVSSAEMLITQRPDRVGWLWQTETEILSRTSLSQIIQDPRLDLYPGERRETTLEDVIEGMRTQDLQIEAIPHPGLSSDDRVAFRIRYRYPNRRKAQAVVQTILTRFQELNLTSQLSAVGYRQQDHDDEVTRLEARIAVLEQRLGITSAEAASERREHTSLNILVLDPPSLPELPAFPNRAIFAASGFGSGFSLAILISLVRRKAPPTVALPV